MNKPIFVLDTNVLLDDRNALLNFPESKIIVPFTVLEELDKHKSTRGEVGANARSTIRLLDNLEATDDIVSGALCENGSTVTIEPWTEACQERLTEGRLNDIPDNRIIATALALKLQFPEAKVNLISNDICVRTKAKLLGLLTDAHIVEVTASSVDDVYDGLLEVLIDPEQIDKLHAEGAIEKPDDLKPFENQFIRFVSNIQANHTALGRFSEGEIVKVLDHKSAAGIRPRNLRQTLSLDILLNQDIELVTLLGKAGTGKTLLAMAAAVEQAIEKAVYDRIILVKAPVPMGPDVGFLPGELISKILPHFESFLDNLYLLFPSYKEKNSEDLVNHLLGTGKLELLPPTYMRGRSLSRTIVIVDEVQNLKKEEVKTIATRIGEGSKVIMLGDINQVDRHMLDGLHNGLTHLVEAFKDEPCAAHLTFVKGERSTFADIAAEVL